MSGKKLHIAQITPYFYPAVGGIEKATYETSKRLVERGHRVTVYTSKSKFASFNVLSDYEEIEGIRVKRFPEYFNIMSTWFPNIDQDVDILHFRNYCINPHSYLIEHYYGKKPIIVTFHGGFSREEGYFSFRPTLYGIGKYMWQYLWGKNLLKRIDAIIALHQWEKCNLIQKGAPAKNVFTVPNGIEDNAFDRYDPVILGKPYILSLSRIAKVKSLDHVLSIVKDLPDICYVIAGVDIGEGEMMRLQSLTRELHIEHKVKFIGEVKGREKYQYIAGAEAVVVPSRWEMLSHTILESMAQSKVVIASDSYGNPYIIDNGKTGLVYRYGDLNGLKQCIIGTLGNKNKQQYLGEKARDKLWRNYRWDRVVDEIESIYYSFF